MQLNRRKFITQASLLAAGTLLPKFAFGQAQKIRVGIMLPYTGTYAQLGVAITNGFKLAVSERGGNFSAGERQLLTFTRAMVAQPRILILDEATSAVDTQTEKVIQHALEELFARRTCFVVAHRLSTVRNAHRIIVLAHGEIIEQGTHPELLARGGHYAKLHQEFVRH